MVRPTVAAVIRRRNDRDELRAAMASCREINLISVIANGDSIRAGSVLAEIVVLDPFAIDAETVYRFLEEHAPKTKVIFLVKSLRSIETLSIPPELVAIQAFDESFESVVVRFLRAGADGMNEKLEALAPASSESVKPPGSGQPLPDTMSKADVGPGRTRPRFLAAIPALGLPRSTRPTERPELQQPVVRIRPDQARSDADKDLDADKRRPDPEVTTQANRPRGAALVATSPSSSNQARSIVVLGASTGGPEAVRTVLGGLPASFPLPILVVQHMPALFTEQFALGLDGNVPLKVGEAVDGTQPRPGEVWVAPGGFHMEIADVSGRLSMSEGPKLHGCRPAVDVLFKSASRVYGAQVLAVVLTGMGHDGADGCQAIADAGGHVIVQDEATSTVWGMPGSVAKRGNAHQIVPIKQVAFTIVGNAAAGRARASSRTSSRSGVLQAEVSQ